MDRLSHEVKQFCQCTFGGAVITADHSRFLEAFACGIDVHVDAARTALGHIQQYLSHAFGFLYQFHEPSFRGSIACTVCLKDDGPAAFSAQDAPCHLRSDAGVELEYGDPRVKIFMEYRSGIPVFWLDYQAFVVPDADAGFGKWREILGSERPEIVGVVLCSPVASHQDVVEADAYFGYDCIAVLILGGGDFYCRDEVFLSVGSRNSDRAPHGYPPPS